MRDDETPEERAAWLRRLAAQLVVMCPTDRRDAIAALDYARELLDWTYSGPPRDDPQGSNLVAFGPRRA